MQLFEFLSWLLLQPDLLTNEEVDSFEVLSEKKNTNGVCRGDNSPLKGVWGAWKFMESKNFI